MPGELKCRKTDDIWEAYYTMACRLLEIVARDYRWAYARYKQGYLKETRWRSEQANFREDFIQALTSHVLHTTAEDIMNKIEVSVDRELEGYNARNKVLH